MHDRWSYRTSRKKALNTLDPLSLLFHYSRSLFPFRLMPNLCLIQSFPAPGPSLLRANHLKETVRCPTASCGQRALRVITATVNLVAAGGVPPEVASFLCGATLLAVKKKSGGLRPISRHPIRCLRYVDTSASRCWGQGWV